MKKQSLGVFYYMYIRDSHWVFSITYIYESPRKNVRSHLNFRGGTSISLANRLPPKCLQLGVSS